MYRQSLPGHRLSIEHGTTAVPDDGYYYVLYEGQVRGRFRTLTQAKKHYAQVKESLNITHEPPPPPSNDDVRRIQMESVPNKVLLWTAEDFSRVDRKTRGRPKHGGGRS